MATRRPSIFLAVGGVVLIIAAILIRFVLVPHLEKLPDDLSIAVTSVGTSTGPDPAAPGKTITTPVETELTITVESVKGDTAVVSLVADTYIAPKAGGSQPISSSTSQYAVDRHNYLQAPPPSGVTVGNQLDALTFSLPPEPDKNGHMLFEPFTQTAQPLAFERTESVSGRDAARYTATFSAPVADPEMLTTFRAALGKQFGTDGTTIPTAALSQFGVPADKIADLAATTPVTAVVTGNVAYVADQQFGTYLNVEQELAYTAVVGDPANPVLSLPLQTVSVKTSDKSISSAADTLSSTATKVKLIAVWIPLALAVIGVIALAFSGARLRKLRKPLAHNNSAESESSDHEPEPRTHISQ